MFSLSYSYPFLYLPNLKRNGILGSQAVLFHHQNYISVQNPSRKTQANSTLGFILKNNDALANTAAPKGLKGQRRQLKVHDDRIISTVRKSNFTTSYQLSNALKEAGFINLNTQSLKQGAKWYLCSRLILKSLQVRDHVIAPVETGYQCLMMRLLIEVGGWICEVKGYTLLRFS